MDVLPQRWRPGGTRVLRASPCSWTGALSLLALLQVGCALFDAEVGRADLVLRNGRVVTLDADRPLGEAIAIGNGRILAVTDEAGIERYVGPGTEQIDLGGRLAIPGFIEGHGHFMGLGDSRLILDLTRARGWSEIVDLVAAAVARARPGEWIRGRGWHQDRWERKPARSFEDLPIHDSLSAVSPENPVVLTHASGHASFVNARALALAGIGADTPDPPGGEILRDTGGRPTGFLRETAQGIVRRRMDRLTREEWRARARRMVELAARECIARGITSFQDAGSSFETIDFLRELARDGEVPLRLWVMVRASNAELERRLARYRTVGEADHHMTVRAIKVSLDGALGSRGAWLLAPYTDAPHLRGFNTVALESVRRTAELALEHGFQLCIHAIGDRANREVLDLYEEEFRAHPGRTDLRWRIEHAQHLHPDDIPRFGKLGVIASMQGVHCTSDGPWVPRRLGERRAREGAYVWRSLLQSGAVIVNGTDAPVEDVSPIASFHASVTRRLADGSEFYPDQRMTREEALRSYTIDAAFAAFEEGLKGSLEPGKLADITVLSRDILTIPEEEIPGTEVVYTIVGGKVVYRASLSEPGSAR